MKPEIKNDPMYHLLKQGKVREFNQRRQQGQACDLRDGDLQNLDLRDLDGQGLDLSGCYLRHADLRDLDLSTTNLERACIIEAKIAGAYFPPELMPEEINLSLVHGTRMRYRR